MTTAQLSQYLETAVDLEKAVFLQARRLAQYKEEIQALDRAARRPAPAPPEAALWPRCPNRPWSLCGRFWARPCWGSSFPSPP